MEAIVLDLRIRMRCGCVRENAGEPVRAVAPTLVGWAEVVSWPERRTAGAQSVCNMPFELLASGAIVRRSRVVCVAGFCILCGPGAPAEAVPVIPRLNIFPQRRDAGSLQGGV